jgi:hypothetical protein
VISRRVALALGTATAMVAAIAALVPRGYFANDDIGLTEYLRKDLFTPWISPILVRAFGFAYQVAPGVPWYGLYLYALIIVAGAVLIHSCIELMDPRPGLGRIATRLGAVMLGASPAILTIGITWTTVSIYALGTAVAAVIAHAQTCQAAGRPMSRLRSVVYGLLFVNGYMLRPEGLSAMAVAMLPVLGWAALRFARMRRLPRRGAVVAVLAPFALVLAIQHRIPQPRGTYTSDFEHYNLERGRIHGQTAYEQLDQRAPELLARAGWTVQDYRDFTSWLIIDERDYPLEKVQRLLDTGGAPERVTLAGGYSQLRAVFEESAVAVWLFVTLLVTGVILAWLRAIERWRGLAFSLGYLVYLVAVPVWMAAHYRFPQRVSLSFYIAASLGLFVYLARAIADHPAVAMRLLRHRRATVALIVIALIVGNWTRHMVIWLDLSPSPYRDALQALEDRVAARKAFVFVFVQAGLVGLDPLRAQPRSYDGLQGGWGTFSVLWYETIARLGVHRGADVFGAMIDNPDAYLLAQPGVRGIVEDWIRRKVHDPSVRLAFVDGAVFPGDRPELYRLVTRPPERGDDEWRARQRDEWAMNEALPGPPLVADLAFRSIAFAAPYEQFLPRPPDPPAATVVPLHGGLRCTAVAEPGDGCAATGRDRSQAGIHVPVHGLRAARFEVSLIDPENIVSFEVHARTEFSRSIRWRWELDPQAQTFGFTGTFTLVPAYPAHRLQLAVDTARPGDIRDLHISVAVKPGSHAGFELHHLEVAEP